MIIILICFLLVFTLIGLFLVWQRRGTRHDAIVNHNRRVAQGYRKNIISKEDPLTLRDKSQLELFDDAELSRVTSESATYRREK